LPNYSDSDGDSITLDAVFSTNGSVSFMTFYSNLYLVTPTLPSDVGSYSVTA